MKTIHLIYILMLIFSITTSSAQNVIDNANFFKQEEIQLLQNTTKACQEKSNYLFYVVTFNKDEQKLADKVNQFANTINLDNTYGLIVVGINESQFYFNEYPDDETSGVLELYYDNLCDEFNNAENDVASIIRLMIRYTSYLVSEEPENESLQDNKPIEVFNEIDPQEYLTRSQDNLKVNKKDIQRSMIINDVLQTPYVDTSKKVYDFSGLLSDNEEKLLKEKCKQIRNQYGLDVVILAINDNSMRSNRKYAQDFYDYNDFGADSIHSGYIISINMTKRRCDWWCEGKPHLADFITYQEDTYSEIAIPLLKGGQYYQAYNDLVDKILEDYLYEISFPIWKCLLFAAILTLIIILAAVSKHHNRAIATNAHLYAVKDSFNLRAKKDSYSHTERTETYSPRESNNNSGGGSSSGGSGGGCSF